MNKKILITILSLLSILILSCNASDKTGSGTTGGNGIKTYAGTWTLDTQNLKVVIVDDSNVTFDGIQMSSIQEESTGVYLLEFKGTKSGDIFLRLNFNTSEFELGPLATGQIADQGKIVKGNSIKVYAGTWTLDIQNLKVVIVDDSNVAFDGIQMSSIQEESTGVYLLEFKGTKSGDIFLRLNFNTSEFELGPLATGQIADQGKITKS